MNYQGAVRYMMEHPTYFTKKDKLLLLHYSHGDVDPNDPEQILIRRMEHLDRMNELFGITKDKALAEALAKRQITVADRLVRYIEENGE